MSSIQNQQSVASLSPSDLFLLYSAANSDTRKTPLSLLTTYLASLMTLPNGILSASGLYVMNAGPVALAPNLTNVYANIAGQNAASAPVNPSFLLPAAGQALAINSATGEFIAGRNIKACLITVNIAMTYAAARQLTLAVLTGPDVSPYETPLHFSAIGQAATQMYASFTGLVFNPNNANGQINAGDKIRLVAKYDIAGPNVLNIQSLSTQVQTLDGL